jgi:hypothetical protein
MKRIGAQCLLLISSLLLSSCSGALNPGKEAEPKTGVSVFIPLQSPALRAMIAQAKASSRALGSRAYLSATGVDFELFQGPGNSPVATWSASLSETLAGSRVGATPTVPLVELSGLSVFHEISVGTDYRIKLKVYNSANGAGSPAVVAGQSLPFSVVEGQATPVYVTCLPLYPESLLAGERSAEIELAPFSLGEAELGLDQIGGEKWFAYTASSTLTEFVAAPLAGGGARCGLAVFDASGLLLKDQNGNEASGVGTGGLGASLFISTAAGASYFVVVDELGGEGEDRAFTLFADDFTHDPYDGPSGGADDTIDAATILEIGAIQDHSILGSDVDFFSFVATAGKRYDIIVGSGDGAGANLDLILYDYEDNEYATASGRIETGSFPSVTDWDCSQDGNGTGTYYIRLAGENCIYTIQLLENDAPSGASIQG